MFARLRAMIIRRRRALAIGAIAFAVYCVAAEVWLPRDDSLGEKLDAVIVLSSGIRSNGTLDRNGEARLRRGLRIAQAHGAPLYTTRVRRRKPPHLISDSGQRVLIDSAGLRGSWVILDGIAINTRDEAERLRSTLPAGRVAVVTSNLHTRRACATFEQLGFTVTCVQAGGELPWWKAPYFVLYESAALVKYRLKGWI